jgi:hypothetical protein
MGRRSHRQNLVVWNSSAGPARRNAAPRVRRRAPTGRIPWWIRTGVLLAVIGLMRLPRVMRTRWRPVLLLAGGLLAVAGVILPSSLTLIPGMLVVLLTARIPRDSSTAFIDPALMPFLVDARTDRPAAR